MRLYSLLESSYKDVFPKTLVDFIDNNKTVYNNNIFIHFTNSKDVAFSNGYEENSGLGMECYPLTFFIRNPVMFSKIASSKRYFRVIEPKSTFLKINAISRDRMFSDMKNLGISDPDDTYNQIMNQSHFKKKEYSFGYALFSCLRHKISNGNIADQISSTDETVNKLRKLGYSGIYDTSKIISFSILSNNYPSVCFVVKPNSVKTLSSYDTHNDSGDNVNDFDNDAKIRKLAAIISNALDTKLNSDDPFSEGLDHYFWTYDGLQIRITPTFSTSKSSDATNTSFIIDIETPFGVLYHTSSPEDTFSYIGTSIAKQYGLMNTPLPDWKPKNVDIFLASYEAEYKDMEQRQDDIISEVNKYYPLLRQVGLKYNIKVPEITFYSDYEKVFVNGIMDKFRKSESARMFLDTITNNDENTDMKYVSRYFPRERLPKNMSFITLKKMAIIYDIAKKVRPYKSGWNVFTSK